MWYVYKIKRAFNDKKKAKKLVLLLWARSFDKIVFRWENWKTIDTYHWFLQYPFWLAEIETNRYIDKMYKNWAIWCEFIRK